MRQLTNLLIGGVMGFFYFPWVHEFVKNKWNNFEISNVNHWCELWKLWQRGAWKIDNASDYFFVAVLLGFIPLFVFAWHVVCDVASSSDDKKQTKDSEVKEANVPPPLPVSTPIPEAENISTSELLGAQKRPPALRTKAPLPIKQAMPVSAVQKEIAPVVLAPAPTPVVAPEKTILSQKELLDALGMIIKKSGFEVFQNVTINKQSIQFAAISANNITLLNMMPEGEEWVADEESFNNEPPAWFSENDFYSSPIFALKQASEALEKRLKTSLPEEYNFNMNAILVIGSGKVLNADAMLKTWEDMNVSVVRFADGLPETLPQLAEKLIETKTSEAPDRFVELVQEAIRETA